MPDLIYIKLDSRLFSGLLHMYYNMPVILSYPMHS